MEEGQRPFFVEVLWDENATKEEIDAAYALIKDDLEAIETQPANNIPLAVHGLLVKRT